MKRTFTLLSAMVLMLCGVSVFAQSKVTVGVGHMCCGACKAAAVAGLAKVASDVSVDGKNITMTLKDANLVPVLDALRKSGFPANQVIVGSKPATLTVGHLCCGGCKSGLTAALKNAKIEELDTDAIKVGEDNVMVQAKAGKSLDLIPLLAAMEKGGFSATKITFGTAAASRLNERAVSRTGRTHLNLGRAF